MRYLPNLSLVTWLAVDVVRELRGIGARSSGEQCVSWILCAALAVTGYFVIFRPPARSIDIAPVSSVVVAAALAWPFLFLLRPATSASSSILVLKISAALVLLCASLFLGPSYSVIPAFRSLSTKGPYRVVRHPIYASYLLFDMANWVSGDWPCLLIWMGEAIILDLRASIEENLLSRQAEYRVYQDHVRWRFIPGIR